VNISYISSFDATDINSYSGTGYFIPTKLKDAGDTISYVGNLSQLNPLHQKIKRNYYSLLGKKYLIERNPGVLKLWASQIRKETDTRSQVLVAYSSQPFAKLDIARPKVFWADAVFANMVDYYEVYSNLCQESIKDGNRMEYEAIHNASIAVYSSEWAAKAAIEHYNVPDGKVKVIPYGANINVDYTDNDIAERAKNKPFDVCNLLFLGVEWERKGGDKAVAIARELNQRGIKTILSIVGVNPGEEIEQLDFVKVYGFINKSEEKGLQLLNQIISDSHFLVLPTRADCTPIVYNEMNAHGIPVITTNEGGIPSVIHDGVNGFMFSKDEDAEEFSNAIEELFSHKEKYIELSRSAFNEYLTRLNWKTSIAKFRKILKEVI